MKVYTAAQMREREQAAVDKGTSFDQLMENAGSSAARDLMQRHPQAGRALIVCGKGNNGGDGLVMARYMQAQGLAHRYSIFTRRKPLPFSSNQSRTPQRFAPY